MARIDLLNVPFSNGETNSSSATGSYYMVLPPGTYDVQFSVADYLPATARVTCTLTSATVLDVQLSPVLPASPQNLRIVSMQ